MNHADALKLIRKKITVRGTVQGVGFRPYIYRLAARYQLTGQVMNTREGVEIEVEGRAEDLGALLNSLHSSPPLLARINEISWLEIPPTGDEIFQFRQSRDAGRPATGITPDAATCRQCLTELFDPADRRYNYPFINCINCGPRYTIVKTIPYDRAETTMGDFKMCPECEREYLDPAGRRFHAQPNCCDLCGPKLSLHAETGGPLKGDPIENTASRLAAGAIIAIKGLGGFHLAVDARNTAAVQRLRTGKDRAEKPFAVMVRDLATAERLCLLNPQDINSLSSVECPIVIALKRTDSGLAEAVAPGGNTLGIMLPCTPLHHLIFAAGRRAFDALIMTSGNRSEEPICLDLQTARSDLNGIADYYLDHDRVIHIRNDDSIVSNINGQDQIFRRSRGYAPLPINLGIKSPPLLAVGAELKNTVCLLSDDRAILSQHIGDLKNLSAYQSFTRTIDHLRDIFAITPEIIVHDLHPDYLSSRWAAEQHGVPQLRVQHHHAHLAACLAENAMKGPALGIILDGSGYGPDQTIWGGEILIGDLHEYQRIGRLEPMPLPGGDLAVQEPWRTTVAWLGLTYGDNLPDLPILSSRPIGPVLEMTQKGFNTPLTSSCGRLFDVIANICGGPQIISYEGQAAISLMRIAQDQTSSGYPYEIHKTDGLYQISVQSLIKSVINGIGAGEKATEVSRRFHQTLVEALTELLIIAGRENAVGTVALSGGVLQNRILLSGLTESLDSAGFRVIRHRQVPANDGGISLGQAVIGREHLLKS